jgi:5S rRNA maturation endonuclease (ribonuclease M5)
LNDEERLERIEEVLERLDILSNDHVILVEGLKDIRALEAVGIRGDFFTVQASGGPVAAAEYVESRGTGAVVLTDWDRKGNMLAEQLLGLLPPGPGIDTAVRSDLSRLCGGLSKDVESLDSVVSRLRALCAHAP